MFQNIHGLAVRRNKGNVAVVKDRAHAILGHYSSTPDNPNTANTCMGEILDPAINLIWLEEKRITGHSKIPYQKQLSGS